MGFVLHAVAEALAKESVAPRKRRSARMAKVYYSTTTFSTKMSFKNNAYILLFMYSRFCSTTTTELQNGYKDSML